jgi:hypothetical protein
LEQTEALGVTVEFGAAFEEGLVSDADAEERLAGMDERAAGLDEILATEGVEAVVEASDAWEDDGARVAEVLGV